MSTRSGKRIHKSVIEEEIEILKPKRKTRSNKQKENCVQETVVSKKKNFVRYPSEEDVDSVNDVSKSVRELQRATLQELNGLVSEESDIEKKPIRLTRSTKKNEDVSEVTTEVIKKPKKKKTVKNVFTSNTDIATSENVSGKSKLSKKKKKKSSIIVEDQNVTSLNKSNTSVDSFHSAAGSTLEGPINEASPSPNHMEKKKKKKSKKQSFSLQNYAVEEAMSKNTPEEITEINHDIKIVQKKSKISKDIVVENEIESVLNNTFEKEKSIRKSSIKNSTFDIITGPTIHNTSYESKQNENDFERRPSLIMLDNSTDINSSKILKPNGSIKSLNSTYDKTPGLLNTTKNQVENTLTTTSTTFEKESCSKMDTTFEKDPKSTTKLNSTFEKSNETVNLDAIFHKASDSSKKSSLLSSDRSNITDDKSNTSRISITSDDSMENIVNTTPVLVESSMDESIMKEALPLENNSPLHKSISNVDMSPHTPIRREGTFTKESNSPIINDKTLSKRISIPSPGRTPFPFSKNSSKEKSVLNVTRSVEKSRRSSLIDLPRATKVMFCSPVNNQGIVNQMRGKVIKSNLKGSNKSFVFNESVSGLAPSARKRSYTQSDADDRNASSKRKRLAEDLQQSVDRLSRPRTTSASGKLQDTPSKHTPQKAKEKVSRTKLPNFAALHQKQFSKMESLDECQQRKAKRAKQMLALSSSLSKDRTSPTDTIPKEAKKTETPVKLRHTMATLATLNPGYTRFGFKMHSDVNPFANTTKNDLNSTKIDLNSTKIDLNSTKIDPFRISTKLNVDVVLNGTKTAVKSKAVKSKELKRTVLPSLAGSTVRKEMAKQTIMREKSFTEKRDVSRKENRTIIKGVRTNRRFELQMKLRNIN